jgi:hypothetical protein
MNIVSKQYKIPVISLSLIPGIMLWNWGYGMSYLQLICFFVLLLLVCFVIGIFLKFCCRWLSWDIFFDLWLYDEEQYSMKDYIATLVILLFIGIVINFLCPYLKTVIVLVQEF